MPPKGDAILLRQQEGCPRIHLSPIASGRQVVRDDRLRQQFSAQVGALAFDCEFDTVIESILGNCKDSFICIRGISDYKDGTRRKEWQPYASLAAASVMKSIICGMEAPTNSFLSSSNESRLLVTKQRRIFASARTFGLEKAWIIHCSYIKIPKQGRALTQPLSLFPVANYKQQRCTGTKNCV
ncbi:hypothetical protein NQ317_008376 [Molorchus minor]|uniref:Uncharacterized protein n=1 Tax=Molorchus minor TaxID=1323400 RepID=A0ABQ9K425_9CUCU|nr:hypothetical protein NQ317_008376 [Molorchus minor]